MHFKQWRLLLLASAGVLLATLGVEAQGPGQWAYTAGSLNTPRAFHTATLMNNGEVLVVGGQGSSGILASVEI